MNNPTAYERTIDYDTVVMENARLRNDVAHQQAENATITMENARLQSDFQYWQALYRAQTAELARAQRDIANMHISHNAIAVECDWLRQVAIRLQSIEQKAFAQSEDVQRHWLSPVQVRGIKALLTLAYNSLKYYAETSNDLVYFERGKIAQDAMAQMIRTNLISEEA